MTLFADPALLAPLLGAIVGLILALSGAGGGIIAVPLLVIGLGLPMREAAPIGLIAVGAAAALGAVLGLRRGILRYRAAALIGAFGVLTAPLGVWLAQHLPNRPLMVVFAALLLWTAWKTWQRSRRGHSPAELPAELRQPCQLNPQAGRLDWTLPCARALAGTGALSGLLSGLLGVGGGFVIVPALNRYSNLPMPSVLATSLGVIALVAVGGIASAAWQGSIVWSVALSFGAGAVTGLLIGQTIAARLAGSHIQRSFALVCVLAAVLLCLRAAGWMG